jgi:hypothetical protein
MEKKIDKYFYCQHKNTELLPHRCHDSTLEELREYKDINEMFNRYVYSSANEIKYDCLKAILMTGKQKNLMLDDHSRFRTFNRMNKMYLLKDKINLDDPFWRHWFFVENKQYLYQYCNLHQLIKNKKKELQLIYTQIQNSLSNKITTDIIKYIICSYI